MEIYSANSEEEIKECYPAFKELRPHLSEQEFITQALRQMNNHNYKIVYIKANNEVVAASGYRVAEFLAWGKTLYVDDLITISSSRNSGYGGALIEWLIKKANELACQEFHLDSGPHRHDAHRFYLNTKLNISSFHFSNEVKKLKSRQVN